MKYTIHNGSNIDILKQYPDNHFDSVVTDPPYGLSFMGKKWDYDVPSVETWKEVYRVLKPGGHLLSFFGSRTYHRGAIAIEDAGFEIRDQIMWIYGSGFPKSHDIQKKILERYQECLLSNNVNHAEQISPLFQVELNEVKIDFAVAFVEIFPEEKLGLLIRIGKEEDSNAKMVILQLELKKTNIDLNMMLSWKNLWEDRLKNTKRSITETKLKTIIGLKIWNYIQKILTQNFIIKEETNLNGFPYPVISVVQILDEELRNMKDIPMLSVVANVTEIFIKKFDGRGTATKPAHEPIVVARKPLEENTIAENVVKYGTGAFNIDESRVAIDEKLDDPRLGGKGSWKTDKAGTLHEQGYAGKEITSSLKGRWPANIIHDGSDEVVESFPNSNGSDPSRKLNRSSYPNQKGWGMNKNAGDVVELPDGGSGSAARFFYVAKTSKADREEGLDHFNAKHTAASEFRPNHMEKAEAGEDGNPYGRFTPLKNNHPTVKPTALMEYLVTLVTPKGGTVLDPFMGSGSTGKACMNKNFNFVGVDLDKHYCEIAEARIAHAHKKNSSKLTRRAKKT